MAAQITDVHVGTNEPSSNRVDAEETRWQHQSVKLHVGSLEVNRDERWWDLSFTLTSDDGPTVRGIARVTTQAGVTIRSITVESPNNINTTVWKQVPLTLIRKRIVDVVESGSLTDQRPLYVDHEQRKAAKAPNERYVSMPTDEEYSTALDLVSDLTAAFSELPRPRRLVGSRIKRDRDDTYRTIAHLYLMAYQDDPHKTINRLMEVIGLLMPRGQTRPSKETVRTWVRRAAEVGWLTKGTQGRAGRGPGLLLIRWAKDQGIDLQQQEDEQ